MEEYPHPLTVEGPWPSTSTRTTRTLTSKLQIYFQSRKKSQGGDCTVKICEQSGVATVLFKSEETRDQVLSKRDHCINIERQVVKLRVFKPGDTEDSTQQTSGAVGTERDDTNSFQQSGLQTFLDNDERESSLGQPPNFGAKEGQNDAKEISSKDNLGYISQSSAVILEKLPKHFSRDTLVLLVENLSGLTEDEFALELTPKSTSAVVTFNDHSVAEKFLLESKSSKKFQQYGLEGQALEKSRSVIVKKVPGEASQELLELLFEKWGGSVERLFRIPEEQTAIVTFHDQADAQRFLDQTNHMICQVSVSVQPYIGFDIRQRDPTAEESTSQSSAVVLEKLPNNFSRDTLLLFVENISGLSEEEFSLELLTESNIAVVMFNDPSVSEMFLMKSRSNKKFQQYGLIGRALEKCRSIKVENVPSQANKDLLELYFEKCGKAVETITMIPEDQAAIVTFPSHDGVQNILKKEHHICQTSVRVYPYFTSLGTALYGKDRPTWSLPKPFTEKIHPAIREFLHKNGLISSVCDQMSSYFCDVNMDKAEVQLSPLPTLLKQKDLTKTHIDGWKQNALDSFRSILSSYAVFEHAVMPSMWATVEKDIRSVVKDKAFMKMDGGFLTLAGNAQDINLLKKILEDFLKKASSQMERDKNTDSDTLEMPSAMYSLLLQEGLQRNALAKYPELKLTHRKDTNQLILQGLPLDIIDIKNWILERKLRMKQKTLRIEPSVLEFLRSGDCDEMSKDLFTSKGISVIYRVENGDVVLMGSTDSSLSQAEKHLQMTLTYRTLSLEDRSMLETPEWHSLRNQLFDKYNSTRKKTVVITTSQNGDTLVVSGFKDPVSDVSQNLEMFINKHSKIINLPKPFTVKIHPDIREFLLKKGLISSICDQMSSYFCNVNIDEAEVQLSPLPTLLKQKDISKRQVDSWRQNAIDGLRAILSNYAVFEHSVTPTLWSKIEKDIQSIAKDNTVLRLDNELLTLAGLAQDINLLKPILEDFLKKALNQMERDKNTVSDTMEISAAMYSLLLQEGLQHSSVAKYPELKLEHKSANQLKFQGLPVEIIDVKSWILERRLRMKQKSLTMDASLIEFLRSADCDEMSKDLFTSKGINSVYKVENGDVVLMGSTESAVAEAEKRLQTMLQSRTLSLEDQSVLEKPEWHSLRNNLSDTYNSSKKKTVVIVPSRNGDTLVVSGFKDPVSEVSTNLEMFINKHSRIEKVIRLKSCAALKFINEKKSEVWKKFVESNEVKVNFDPRRPLIRLSGERVHVQPVMENFQEIAKSLHTDRMIIKKAGAKKFFQEQRAMFMEILKEHRFVIVLEEGQMLEEDEEDEDHYDSDRLEDFGQISCKVQMPYGVTITDRKADICQLKVDAVVNAASTEPFEIEPMDFEDRGALDIPSSNQLSRTLSDDFSSSGLLEKQSTQEGLRIILRKGNIQDATSDVIVNTIGENVDLGLGTVSKALLGAAGPQLQLEASSHLPSFRSSKLNFGDIVDTRGYNLNCRRVFHAVCPFWNGRSRSEAETLEKIIEDCLKKAEQQRMTSVSFPALGTGNLRFPKDLVSSIMLRAIHDFSAKFSPRHCREVTVVVHPSDDETVQCFVKRFRGGKPGPVTKRAQASQKSSPKKSTVKPSQSPGLFGVVSTPTLGVHKVQVGHVTLEVSSGDITKEKCDAIVNSSNSSFSLKLGVSKAILDAAGSAVEQECEQAVKGSLQQMETIMTSGGQLPCKHIIHTVGRNTAAAISNVVYSVLKLCEEKKFSSVTFPALGTGQGGISPSIVADAMIDAVTEFVKKKKAQHLQSVKFLIFQAIMVSDFYQSMQRRQQEEEDTDVMGWIKGKFDAMNSLFSDNNLEASVNEDFVMVEEEVEPAVFQLCGESQRDLNNAKELINSFIVKEHTSSTLRDSAINHFSREDAEILTNLQRDLTVSIQLNKSGPETFITVEGLTRDVLKVERTIQDMIRKVEKNEPRKRDAFMVDSMVEWQYLDNKKNKLKAFDYLTNYDLEQAFTLKQPRIRIKINHELYDVDIARRTAIGRSGQIELKRVDRRDQRSEPLPSHWGDMKGFFVKHVQIQSGTQEYTEVEKEFRRTGLNNYILKIERVQNSTLWRSYMIHKNHLNEKNKHKNNEKMLFHGTGADTVDKIDKQGFNRSYAGMHGAMYGNGAYFAVDPSYSAQGYAKPDQLGHKRMYLAKVLVGDYTTGKQGLLSPPAKSSSGADLYDSVTDNQQKPTMFVIFHDVQAYPEYLITFQ